MADQLQFRGGTTAQVNAATVVSRELIIDTSTDQIVSGPSKKKTVMEDANGDVEIGGDIDLGTVGTFSTTLQTVTPTANRTVSIPDATGTIGLVNGPTGSIQFNQAGALNGTSDFSTSLVWNSATTTFTGLKLNVTNTASAAGSKLLDLQSGGNTKLSLGGNELILETNRFNGSAQEGLFFSSDFNQRVGVGTRYGSASAGLSFWALGSCDAGIWNWGFSVNGNKGINFGPGTCQSANPDTSLLREGVGILAQRYVFGGSDPQEYRLYNTYTDASNYQRTSISDDSTGLIVNQEYAGTGAARTNLLDLQVGGTTIFSVGSVGNTSTAFAWRIGTASVAWSPYTGATAFGNTGGNPAFTIEGALGAGIPSAAMIWWTASPSSGAYSQRDIALTRDQANVLKVTDGSTGTGYLKLIPTTVGALTAAATVGAGTKAFVNDANATTFASVVAGGGSNVVPVYSDGTDWRIG